MVGGWRCCWVKEIFAVNGLVRVLPCCTMGDNLARCDRFGIRLISRWTAAHFMKAHENA